MSADSAQKEQNEVQDSCDSNPGTEKWFFSVNGKDTDHGVLQFMRKK